MDFYVVCGSLAMAGGLLATIVYIVDTLNGKTRPHALTWCIWSILTGIAAAVAYAGDATVSFYVQALGAIVNFSVFLLALKYGERRSDIKDWSFFIAALSVLPVWFWTQDAFWAAFLASMIDFLGAMPTFRKAWIYPQQENAKVFLFYSVTNVLSIASITPLTINTGLYPFASFLINLIVVILIFSRYKKNIVIAR